MMNMEEWKANKMNRLNRILDLLELNRTGDLIDKSAIVDYLDKNIDISLLNLFENFNIELEGSDTED